MDNSMIIAMRKRRYTKRKRGPKPELEARWIQIGNQLRQDTFVMYTKKGFFLMVTTRNSTALTFVSDTKTKFKSIEIKEL